MWKDQAYSTNWDMSGFVESRFGMRTQDQDFQNDVSLAEIRSHLDLEYAPQAFTFKLSGDVLYDDVEKDDFEIDRGAGWFDLREVNVSFRPLSFMDVKVGRQILTWGTGDMVFINDLFPKDWKSFFSGRDDAYLKAPSDAIKTSFFSDIANLDVVYLPRHNASRFIDGSRLSYFSPSLMRPVSNEDPEMVVDENNGWFKDDEVAMRLSRSLGSTEIAGYMHLGYWKTPEGMDVLGTPFFPRLNVYGASVRSPFQGGIFNLEAGYYDSPDDAKGNNPFVRNSEFRGLIGFEREVATNLTLGLQYYTEIMQDYDAYLATLPLANLARDEQRDLITTRLTYMLNQQTLILSLFNYYSPTDEDGYVRPKVTYKATDAWTFEVGANIFWGKETPLPGDGYNTTFFGQFEENTNVYVSGRLNF
ncbi:MAG: hypothetical protein JXR30_03875 [Alphaproteobacteria bacterium]|nr:hypothetical protein [Alphaproteobacteria bacterium]